MDEYLKNFLGLSLLEESVKRALTFSQASYGGWLDRNAQTRRFDDLPENKRKLIGLCPHYALLETVAEILLIKPEEFATHEKFCGFFVSADAGRFPSYGHSRDYNLVITACNTLDLILATALQYVQMEKPCELSVGEKTSWEDLEKSKGTIAQWVNYQTGKKIMEAWKISLPQVVRGVQPDDGYQIIRIIGNFHQSIRNNCTGDGSFLSPVCKLAPKFHEV